MLKDLRTDTNLSDEFAGYVRQMPEHPQDKITRIFNEYKTRPLTPELITVTWQTFLRSAIEKAGLNIPVGDIPRCDRPQEELENLRKEGRGMVYCPDVGYPLLSIIFPKMQSHYIEKGTLSLKDEHDSKGWVDVEMDLESPNRNTTEKDLAELFKSKGKRGQTLRTYIWAAQFSKAITGHYFDENKSSWLLGSRDGGGVAVAGFGPHGDLRADWLLHPWILDPSVGGRSEGVKKV